MKNLFNDHLSMEWNNPHKGRRTFELTIGSHKYHVDHILFDTPESPLLNHLERISKALRAAEQLFLKPISHESLSKLESSLMAIDGQDELETSYWDDPEGLKIKFPETIFTDGEIKIEEVITEVDDFNESQQAQKTRVVLEVVADVISDKEETRAGKHYLVPMSVINELEARYKKLKHPEELDAAKAKVKKANDDVYSQLLFISENRRDDGDLQRQLASLYNDLANAMDELADLKAQSTSG